LLQNELHSNVAGHYFRAKLTFPTSAPVGIIQVCSKTLWITSGLPVTRPESLKASAAGATSPADCQFLKYPFFVNFTLAGPDGRERSQLPHARSPYKREIEFANNKPSWVVATSLLRSDLSIGHDSIEVKPVNLVDEFVGDQVLDCDPLLYNARLEQEIKVLGTPSLGAFSYTLGNSSLNLVNAS
jgi:hypothetical protein